ncbi:MAG TPA: deoxyribodipyrimidine photo-lyase [Aliidongia sp.]|uniref:cryptochrome/photolyase family protein n=1 Tax=Aliidongia sp. TaxID=1914230 RepID=UPI002DDD8675|nr:deoxyribodipyrimidine photo-lyase [Aliidongia sp.]HEV2675457.1 deoxyribodipyrimidine photo-lyase [Aliidongia sp.]
MPTPHKEAERTRPPIIVWLRQDLRLADQPALAAAVDTGHPVLPVYVLDDGHHALAPGGASRWWLHHSLTALARDLKRCGSPLILRRDGHPGRAIEALAAEVGAAGVYWGRRYAAAEIEEDKAVKSRLAQAGIEARSFNTSLLFEPWTIENKSGRPYQVFTQYWRFCRSQSEPPAPLAAPTRIRGPAHPPKSDDLDGWALLPTKPDWAKGFGPMWQPGEAGAADRLDHFLQDRLRGYKTDRDRPDKDGTSCLSPHLRFGEISPRQIWHALHHHLATVRRPPDADADAETFLSEIGWREFSYSLLYYNPEIARQPLKMQFAGFPWEPDRQALEAWQRGMTGYPIVDAGMRQLWATGWMHNRVRMIVASFLIKHLLQPWQEGERWFWDTLVDADPASNAASWQWVAGSGADASPYFRIFNPLLQGRKFDPNGDYIRRWVPELAGIDGDRIHEPGNESSARRTSKAGAAAYPPPMIDLMAGRDRALAAFASLNGSQP